jgi:hypothetical protein
LPTPHGSTAAAPVSRTAASVASIGSPSGSAAVVPSASTSSRSRVTSCRPAISLSRVLPRRTTSDSGSQHGSASQKP